MDGVSLSTEKNPKQEAQLKSGKAQQKPIKKKSDAKPKAEVAMKFISKPKVERENSKEPKKRSNDKPLHQEEFVYGVDDKQIDPEGLGLRYFFGESAVSPEVESLVAGFTNYADELVAAEHSNPPLERIKEDPCEHSPKGELADNSGDLAGDEELKKETKKLAATCGLVNNIGLPDIKSLCKSLAYTVRQHIIFSRSKKMLSELPSNESQDFLQKALNAPLQEKPALAGVDPEKAKEILSESIASMTGTQVKPEMLKSYLTIEDSEEVDFTYTKSQLGEIFGKNSDVFLKSYQNNLGFFKASNEARAGLLKTQVIDQFTIQGLSRYLEARAAKSDEEAIDEEDICSLSEDSAEENLLDEFAVFNLNYDFEAAAFDDISSVPAQYLEVPSEKEVYKFCKKLLVYGKMEKEVSIVGLIYIEKLILKTGLLMNELNWRRFVFAAFILASKVLLLNP
eukprot:TRINITY_DN8241_c0_g3_i5.p1 TRINITY_DN8241_c0_g3~~TRINITY_DN8241_c0_g3_i5.p1  ORF type:complete len:453 (+),score=150.36 TRINITY_DN8241_c0_g3_i5:905-2263(+)